MGQAYVHELLADKTALLFQMQSYAACSDPVIQARVRDCYGTLVKEVTRLSGAPPEDVWQFFSHGMLLNVVASLDLASIAEERAVGAGMVRARGADREERRVAPLFRPRRSNRSQPAPGAPRMLDSLARLIHRRRRRVLVGAVLLVVVAGAVGGPVAGLLDSDDDFDPPSAEAVQAREAIARATGASATPDVVALVRLGAPRRVAPPGRRAAARSPAPREGPEVARVDAYRPGGPAGAGLARRPLQLRRDHAARRRGRRRARRPPRGRGPASRSAAAR